MAGTMEGLGIPINGGYTCYTSDGTTEYLTTNADGTMDFTFANLGADNYISVTTTNTSANTSGYVQSFYTSVSHTGGMTGGQINCFAADLSLGGTIAGVEISGAYVYIAESSTAVTFSSNILAGYTAYFAAFGSACDYRAGFHCYSAEATTYNASALDAGLLVECAGSTGTWGSVIGVMGVSLPKYFMHITTAPGTERMIGTGALGNPAACTVWAKVLIQSTTYWIPLHASCTS